MDLIILDPGHFHAALLQKEMYSGLSKRVSVYAPLGPDVVDYLSRIWRFNTRADNPTEWDLDVHLSRDPLGDMLRQRPGSVVLMSGRNRGKIDAVLALLDAGLHVLVDKPWIVSQDAMPKLERAIRLAKVRGVTAYDIMTERYEVTSQLQRELVNDADIFGHIEPGSLDAPGVEARSTHYLMKLVAGLPLRRPAWFFELENGEALADVGTHVVDLVQWTAFPGRAIDYRFEIEVLEARRWPLPITRAQFVQVTGEAEFPKSLHPQMRHGKLDYYCNNSVHYKLRGIHVKLEIVWKWEAPAGGDVYESVFRGTRSRVEVRQGAAENYVPELYVVPSDTGVTEAINRKVAALSARWPRLSARKLEHGIHIAIPPEFRVGHEAHFAQVASRFFDYVRSTRTMPEEEAANMLAKYYICTGGVEMAREP